MEKQRGRWGWLEAFLLSYSQIFFAKDRKVGLLMFAATATRPDLLLLGGISVLFVNLSARWLRMSDEAIRSGMFGYNGLLLGLAFAYFFKMEPPLFIVLWPALVAVALITAALRTTLSYYFNLPPLSLPFLIVFYPVFAAGESILRLSFNLKGVLHSPFQFSFPEIVTGYLKSLGAVLFMPDVAAGSLLFLSLLLFSRVATLLSLMGYGIALLLIRWVWNFPPEHLYLSVGFNLILISIAVGGIWFVPQKSSFLLSGLAVLFCTILLAGVLQFLSFFRLPALILPFNLTLLALLYGMRQRIQDLHPKSVDFESATPESSLYQYQTRMTRLGTYLHPPISLPFLGVWTCTQGNEGPYTHQASWAYAYDFEVKDFYGKSHKNDGLLISDYYCYQLPVLACADGQVVKVTSHLPDNPIGEPNSRENWGNLVMVQHGPSLFSLVSHLAPGTSKLKEGDFVRRGDRIGLCGNSGRSSTPHLHFHLQRTSKVGAPTFHCQFHEVILEEESPLLLSVYTPQEGDRLRNIQRHSEIADRFAFPIGLNFSLICHFEKREWIEEVESFMDLYGHLKLRSLDGKSVLSFENKENRFLIYDFEGPADSALFVLYASTPRVPYELTENLVFHDRVSSRPLLTKTKKVLFDFIAPFFLQQGVRMDYRCEMKENDFIIIGNASGQNSSTYRLIQTKAVFRNGMGWMGGYFVWNGKRMEVKRLE